MLLIVKCGHASTGAHGAVVSPKVEAYYRRGDGTETDRVLRNGEGITDICRLNELFAKKYPSFSVDRGRARVSTLAWQQYQHFAKLGDRTAADTSWILWRNLAHWDQRLLQSGKRLAKSVMSVALRGSV